MSPRDGWICPVLPYAAPSLRTPIHNMRVSIFTFVPVSVFALLYFRMQLQVFGHLFTTCVSVFALLYQCQYLHFCTSVCSSKSSDTYSRHACQYLHLCTSKTSKLSSKNSARDVWRLTYSRHLCQYLHYCTSKASKMCSKKAQETLRRFCRWLSAPALWIESARGKLFSPPWRMLRTHVYSVYLLY
jgi:hypothetical protein